MYCDYHSLSIVSDVFHMMSDKPAVLPLQAKVNKENKHMNTHTIVYVFSQSLYVKETANSADTSISEIYE